MRVWQTPQLGAALVCLLAGGACASTASGYVARQADGRFSGLAPRTPASVASPLHAAGVTVDPHLTTAYESLVSQYLGDVAHDSGSSGNVYAIAAQYGDSSGPGIYSKAFGGALGDVSAYPADAPHGGGGCTPGAPRSTDPPYVWCLTDNQLLSELDATIAAHGLPTDLSASYFVFLPPGVDVCFAPGQESSGNLCADTDFCAYHSSTSAFAGPVYAIIPYADISGCRSGNQPNASPADAAISLVSHEDVEAISDPLGTGWLDGAQNEIADKCVAIAPGQTTLYGPALGAPGAQHNETINGHNYYLQEEFSNSNPTSLCAQQPGSAGDTPTIGGAVVNNGGPVMRHHTSYAIYWDPAPVARIASPAVAAPGQAITLDASASADQLGGSLTYSWSFGDGSAPSVAPTVAHSYAVPGQYAVGVTVTNSGGASATAQRTITVATPGVPGAAFTTPAGAINGRPVAFDASASTDTGSTITIFSWDFGDGTTRGSGSTTSHAFPGPGTYTVTLTVTDASGQSSSAAHQLVVAAAAVPAPPPSGTPPPRPPQPGLAHLASASVPVSSTGRASLRVACGSAPCIGRVTLTLGRTTVRLGQTTFSLATGASRVVLVRLSHAGLAKLRSKRRLAATVTITPGGGRRSITLVLKPRRAAAAALHSGW
jgi:hypothetical protein